MSTLLDNGIRWLEAIVTFEIKRQLHTMGMDTPERIGCRAIVLPIDIPDLVPGQSTDHVGALCGRRQEA